MSDEIKVQQIATTERGTRRNQISYIWTIMHNPSTSSIQPHPYSSHTSRKKPIDTERPWLLALTHPSDVIRCQQGSSQEQRPIQQLCVFQLGPFEVPCGTPAIEGVKVCKCALDLDEVIIGVGDRRLQDGQERIRGWCRFGGERRLWCGGGGNRRFYRRGRHERLDVQAWSTAQNPPRQNREEITAQEKDLGSWSEVHNQGRKKEARGHHVGPNQHTNQLPLFTFTGTSKVSHTGKSRIGSHLVSIPRLHKARSLTRQVPPFCA